MEVAAESLHLDRLLMEERVVLIDDNLLRFMGAKQVTEIFLSTICILYNFLLLVFLVKTKEFRNWASFPMMLQAFLDLIGPGIANIVFEWKLAFEIEKYIEWMAHRYIIIFLLPHSFVLFTSLHGIAQCVSVYLKVRAVKIMITLSNDSYQASKVYWERHSWKNVITKTRKLLSGPKFYMNTLGFIIMSCT